MALTCSEHCDCTIRAASVLYKTVQRGFYFTPHPLTHQTSDRTRNTQYALCSKKHDHQTPIIKTVQTYTLRHANSKHYNSGDVCIHVGLPQVPARQRRRASSRTMSFLFPLLVLEVREHHRLIVITSTKLALRVQRLSDKSELYGSSWPQLSPWPQLS